MTDGSWHDWDPNKPPTEYMELADPKQTVERPDQWIKPDEWARLYSGANLGHWLFRLKLHRLRPQVPLDTV